MVSFMSGAIAAQLGGRHPWPDNVTLYQPYEGSQILLPDAASCLSVKTFLNMCGLSYKTEVRLNAEEMSPSGKIPFIQVGPLLISELDPIAAFVNAKGHQLSAHLSETEKAEMKAYMALVENVLTNAELYLTWCEPTVCNEVTKLRYGVHHPWPLTWILPLRKQLQIKRKLKAINWWDKSFEEVCDDVQTCVQSLSERLGKSRYFFGERPTELDALVYGHLFMLLTTSLPVPEFAVIVQKFANLGAYVKMIDQTYFRETELCPDYYR